MISERIFSNLIQTYESKATTQQKQALVKETVETVQTSDLPSVLQQLHSDYDEILSILKNHPQQTVKLVFSKLIVEDCVRLMKTRQTPEIQPTQQNGLLRLLNDLGKSIQSQKHKVFIEWLSKTYTKFSGLQKVIIFMKQLVNNYVHKYSHQYLPEIIADFINSSRLVVQAYMKLKSQAPKYDYEFMEHGDYITKWTQSWVKDFYSQFLRKLSVPESKQLRLAVLNGVCDIIGAVLEVQRQGNIEFKMCSQILEECYVYVKKVTSLAEFNQMYLRKLEQNGFNIAPTKIIIPTRYPSNLITFPKQSYSFIVYKFLQQSTSIYTHQTILNYLIPLINQIAPFQYHIKTQIENLFVQVLTSGQSTIKTCFQGGFPLAILYFNIHHFQEKKNQAIFFALNKLFEKIKLESPAKFVNNLKVLSTLKIENLENEINQFIGMKALQVAGSNAQLVVGLIKQIRFVNTNEKGQSVWRQVMGQIIKSKQAKEKVQRVLRQRSEKSKFEKQLEQLVLGS